MSHFVALVLVPQDSVDVEGAVSALLAPYDEAITVAPYATDCYCIGVIASRAGVEVADREVEALDDLRVRYWNLPEDERPEWVAWIADWTATADRIEQAHPLYQKPNPQCEDCHGSGKRQTTYNPDSQWDCWTIGGRWDGWLSEDNQLPAVDVAGQGKIPFAVLTPDGAWHEAGRMGWFGVASDAKDETAWEDEVHSLLLAHPEALAVACDLHI